MITMDFFSRHLIENARLSSANNNTFFHSSDNDIFFYLIILNLFSEVFREIN